MEQDHDILQKISSGEISDPGKCALGFSVFNEFIESDQMSDVQIHYDLQMDEIYLTLTRNNCSSICLPRSIHDDLDLTIIDHFRKKPLTRKDMNTPNQ